MAVTIVTVSGESLVSALPLISSLEDFRHDFGGQSTRFLGLVNSLRYGLITHIREKVSLRFIYLYPKIKPELIEILRVIELIGSITRLLQSPA